MIKKVGSRYCVFTKDGARRIACHSTEAEAKAQLAAIESSKHRELHGLQVGLLRSAVFEGREHVVVPVIALVPGVIHAHNSLQSELVRLEDLEEAPQGWNGRPVMFGHPSRNGRQISANEPAVLEESRIGTVFNARVEGGRLKMDAYLDPARAAAAGAGTLLDKLRSGEQTEVSVGVFVTAEQTPGAHNALRYEAVWHDIVPDHLAFLPDGMTGACSIEMGCGALRAAGGEGSVNFGHAGRPGQVGGSAPSSGVSDEDRRSNDGFGGSPTPREGDRVQVMGNVSGKGKKGVVESEAQSRSFVIVKFPVGGDSASYHVSDLKVLEGGGAMTILEKFKALLESWAPSQEPEALEGQSADELRSALHKALMANVPGFLGVDSYFPEEKQVVYASAPEGAMMLTRCGYRVTDDGTVELDEEKEEVKQVTRYEPVTAAAPFGGKQAPPFGKKKEKSAVYEKGGRYCHKTADGKEMCHDTEEEARAMVAGKKEQKAAAGNCGCGGKTDGSAEKENDMCKKELVQKILAQKNARFAAADAPVLEQLSEERLKVLAEETPPEPEPEPEPEPKPEPTPEEQRQKFLSMFPDVKAVLDKEKARETTRHAELIAACAAVKQDAYTEAELKSLSLDQLERVSKLITASAPKRDYSGAGVPRAAQSAEEEIPAPPSLAHGIRVARGLEKAS